MASQASRESAFSRRSLLGGAAALAGLSATSRAEAPEAGGAPAVPGAQGAPPPAPLKPRTLVLVRHGEKGTDDPRDPSLSEAGLQRAAALVRLLGEAQFTHAFTSEFKRTRDFAAPLAAQHGLAATIVPGKDLDGLVAKLAALPEGSTALVVGHSNTLPAVARKLGAALTGLVNGTDLRDDEYDRCSVITLGRAGDFPALLELRYG